MFNLSVEVQKKFNQENKFDLNQLNKFMNLRQFENIIKEWLNTCNISFNMNLEPEKLEKMISFFHDFYLFMEISIRSDIKSNSFHSDFSISIHSQESMNFTDKSSYASHIIHFFYKIPIYNHPYHESEELDELLKTLFSESIHKALVLHQEFFILFEPLEAEKRLEMIKIIEQNYIFSHELTNEWQEAIRNEEKTLFGLRQISVEDNKILYQVETEDKELHFQVFELNSECVRSMWASQQFELIYGQSTKCERISIQKSSRLLRNIISSSTDPPCGYPSYVSPYVTSFSKNSCFLTDYVIETSKKLWTHLVFKLTRIVNS